MLCEILKRYKVLTLNIVCLVFLVLLLSDIGSGSSVEIATGSGSEWSAVKNKATALLPWERNEKVALKPRIKKFKVHGSKWPHSKRYRDQIKTETKPRKKLAIAGGYPSIRYVRVGFDLTTLIAVSLVSAFLGAITYALVDSGGRRSLGSPFSFLNLIDPETVSRVLSSILDWQDKSEKQSTAPYSSRQQLQPVNKNSSSTAALLLLNSTRNSRVTREVKTTPNPGLILKWYLAYKKDPAQLKCIQKLICESMNASACAARTINNALGGPLMNAVKYFVGSTGDIAGFISEVADNPRQCEDLISSYDFCDGENLKPAHYPEITPIPNFNLSNIIPRSVAVTDHKVRRRNTGRLIFNT